VQQKRTLGLVILRGETIVSVTVEGPPPVSAEDKAGLLAGPGKGVPAGRGMPLGAGESPPLSIMASDALSGIATSCTVTRENFGAYKAAGAPAMAARPMAYARPPPGFQPGMPGLPPGMPPGFPGGLPPGMPPPAG
jgi:small nuclear ribonucleoprotein B and B'